MLTLIEACIFDLDGVITDTAEYHYQGWKKMADEAGLDFSRKINEQLRGVSRRQSLNIILQHNKKELSENEIEKLMKKKNDYYIQSLDSITEKDYLPGIREFILKIKEKGIKTAIASASKNAEKVIQNLNAKGLFDIIADGYSVKNTKPAPDLFLFAAERLNVKPSRSVVFEDAQAGIEAALNGGFFSVGIGPEERVGQAHLRYDGTDEIQLEDVLSLNR
ncbi:MAG: beta-phosphoglucomutase [Bacteroidota bacterium]